MVRRGRDSDIEACGLSYSELQELWLGPGDRSVFDSPEQLRDAWDRGRDVVMRLWGSHGRRPMAWWNFEAGDLEHPGYFRERSVLWRAGVLSQQERTELEHQWKVEFDAARGMDARARREHLKHHDVPDELVEAWTAARRRSKRQSASSREEAAAT